MTRRFKPGIPRRAIYPALVGAAFVASQFGVSNAPVEALPRPLIVGALFGLAAQVALSVIFRSLDRGSFVALVGLFILMGMAEVALILLGWLTIAVLVALRRRRGLGLMPWLRATRVLNGVAVAFLVVALGTNALDGTFWPAAGTTVARGTPGASAPDIYLLMLDGYPRADTLAGEFQFDNGPFLQTMAGLGFVAAGDSHSNYDVTLLTLATLFNGAQFPTLMSDPPKTVTAQFRAATRLISNGSELNALRSAGYEIVTIPSEYYEAAIWSADRVLDSGQLTSFEVQLLSTGGIPKAIGGVERGWLTEQHRSRILAAFDLLPKLAAERSGTPKFVFTHILAPHMPIVFDRAGGTPEPLTCLETSCSLFDYGDAYGDDLIGPMRDQIAWLNGAVEQAVRGIEANSATPPVIVIFSDHGMRNHPADRDEMFRSLFLAATPGQTGVFPDDVTPVNLLSRLLNSYTTEKMPLSSEESYWLDTRAWTDTGFFPLVIQPTTP